MKKLSPDSLFGFTTAALLLAGAPIAQAQCCGARRGPTRWQTQPSADTSAATTSRCASCRKAKKKGLCASCASKSAARTQRAKLRTSGAETTVRRPDVTSPEFSGFVSGSRRVRATGETYPLLTPPTFVPAAKKASASARALCRNDCFNRPEECRVKAKCHTRTTCRSNCKSGSDVKAAVTVTTAPAPATPVHYPVIDFAG